ncbi:MAG: serine protease [Actinomycetota bacterium]|nr:serine protease [Actinomycetota bacterium]
MTPRLAILLVALVAGLAPATARAEDPSARAAVVAGQPAATGAYPWMAGLSMGCGGSLVAPDRVLTAAHCLRDLAWADLRLRVGAQRVRGRLTDGLAVRVADVALHPRFGRGDRPTHDVAVIRLAQPVVGVAPLALDHGDLSAPGTPATVVGFGAVGVRARRFVVPRQLQEGALAILPGSRCRREFGRRLFGGPTVLCVGDADASPPTTSPCVGDSGGPLVGRTAAGEARAVGVVSFGDSECGRDGAPAVFARVAALRDFIADPAPRWAPAPVGRPVLRGTLRAGGTVRCTGVIWRNAPWVVRYRWRLGDEVLRPTRRARRRLPGSAGGRHLACRVAAVNAGGLVRSATSSARRVARG